MGQPGERGHAAGGGRGYRLFDRGPSPRRGGLNRGALRYLRRTRQQPDLELQEQSPPAERIAAS